LCRYPKRGSNVVMEISNLLMNDAYDETQSLLRHDTSINEHVDSTADINNEHLKKDTLSLTHALAMSITSIAPTVNIFFLSGLIAEFSGASAPFVIILAGFMCSLLGILISILDLTKIKRTHNT
jgi:VIT1/CCC1 family predicted Fe2+/Mn2+ transporter